MRGRILWAVLSAATLVSACGRRDSLYIEPGKPEAPPARPAHQAPQKPESPAPGPPKPTEAPPKA